MNKCSDDFISVTNLIAYLRIIKIKTPSGDSTYWNASMTYLLKLYHLTAWFLFLFITSFFWYELLNVLRNISWVKSTFSTERSRALHHDFISTISLCHANFFTVQNILEATCRWRCVFNLIILCIGVVWADKWARSYYLFS